MENPENLDGTFFNAVGGDVWSADNHQFPRPLDPPRSPLMMVGQQPRHLGFDLVTLFDGSHWIVFGDVVNDLFKIV